MTDTSKRALVSLSLLDFARLERKRTRDGLTVAELERREELNHALNTEFSGGAQGEWAERRKSVRVPTRLRCRFQTIDSFEDALITNLSGGGVFIETAYPLPIGSKIDLELRIGETGAELEVPCVVVSNGIGTEARPGMGLRFTTVVPEVMRQMDSLYQKTLERHAKDLESGEEPKEE